MPSSRQVTQLPKPSPVLRGHGPWGLPDPPASPSRPPSTIPAPGPSSQGREHGPCSGGGALGSGLWAPGGWLHGRASLLARPWRVFLELLCVCSGHVHRLSLLDPLSPQHHQLLLFSASRHLWKRSLMKEPPLFLFQIWLLLGTWPFLHQPGARRQEPLLHCLGGSLAPLRAVAGHWEKLTLEPGWQSPQGRDRISTVVRTT